MLHQHVVLTVGGILGLVAAGCSPRLALHPVTGAVTLDSRPLGGVVVMFQPAAGPGAIGMTDAAGRYELQTPGRGRGATLGRHAAWIEVPAAAGAEPIGESAAPVERKPIVDVPPRYLTPATSRLSGTVSAGRNEIDLVLVSAGTQTPIKVP